MDLGRLFRIPWTVCGALEAGLFENEARRGEREEGGKEEWRGKEKYG